MMSEEQDDQVHGGFKFGLVQALLIASAGVAIAVAAAFANGGF